MEENHISYWPGLYNTAQVSKQAIRSKTANRSQPNIVLILSNYHSSPTHHHSFLPQRNQQSTFSLEARYSDYTIWLFGL